MQLHVSKGEDANRSVPPRWLARDAVAAAHTDPPESVIADGALASATRRSTLSVRGSTRITAPVPSATLIAPSPAATATGRPPTPTVPLIPPVTASIRVTVPSSRLATQTPP